MNFEYEDLKTKQDEEKISFKTLCIRFIAGAYILGVFILLYAYAAPSFVQVNNSTEQLYLKKGALFAKEEQYISYNDIDHFSCSYNSYRKSPDTNPLVVYLKGDSIFNEIELIEFETPDMCYQNLAKVKDYIYSGANEPIEIKYKSIFFTCWQCLLLLLTLIVLGQVRYKGISIKNILLKKLFKNYEYHD